MSGARPEFPMGLGHVTIPAGEEVTFGAPVRHAMRPRWLILDEHEDLVDLLVVDFLVRDISHVESDVSIPALSFSNDMPSRPEFSDAAEAAEGDRISVRIANIADEPRQVTAIVIGELHAGDVEGAKTIEGAPRRVREYPLGLGNNITIDPGHTVTFGEISEVSFRPARLVLAGELDELGVVELYVRDVAHLGSHGEPIPAERFAPTAHGMVLNQITQVAKGDHVAIEIVNYAGEPRWISACVIGPVVEDGEGS